MNHTRMHTHTLSLSVFVCLSLSLSLSLLHAYMYAHTQPGRLKAVKAIGWYLDDEDLAQVSVNICDFKTTPLHIVYEEICKDAKVIVCACACVCVCVCVLQRERESVCVCMCTMSCIIYVHVCERVCV